MCAASAYFFKYCILECWLYREMQFWFGVCMCGVVWFFSHIFSHVSDFMAPSHQTAMAQKIQGTAMSLRPALCWRDWL